MMKSPKRDEARHGLASDPIVAGGPVFDELVPRKITKGSKQELRTSCTATGANRDPGDRSPVRKRKTGKGMERTHQRCL